MASFRKADSTQTRKQNMTNVEERYAEFRHAGRIVARVIDAQSGLRVIDGIYAIRMHDEDVRKVFMNDYTPTIGKIMGDVTFLTDKGEEALKRIRGFYKLQHNMFTLLIEGHLEKEMTQE